MIEKGVMLDEIKLYGEPESNDDLDDSSFQDSFGELEEVISKVWTNDLRGSLSLNFCYMYSMQASYIQLLNI